MYGLDAISTIFAAPSIEQQFENIQNLYVVIPSEA